MSDLIDTTEMYLKTVYELSDLFTGAHDGIGIQGWFADPHNRSNAHQLLRAADGVQVTGEGLEEWAAPLHPNVLQADRRRSGDFFGVSV